MNSLIPTSGSNLVPISTAIEMYKRFQQNKDSILASQYQGTNLLATSETVNAHDVKLLLSQPDCVGLRVYSGMDEFLQIHSMLVGVDSNGNDIVIKNSSDGLKDEGGYIVNDGYRCPPVCLPTSIFNI